MHKSHVDTVTSTGCVALFATYLLYVLLNEFHLCYIWRLWLLCSYCAWPVLHLLIDDGSVLYPLVCPLQRNVQC